ncbi:MAG: hypothetical protein OJF49_003393 [Ktedonobacterales bacterium]|nr:MAG: hypothetical protein OJF49_003393 [Ktedonobacterales bacterium]
MTQELGERTTMAGTTPTANIAATDMALRRLLETLSVRGVYGEPIVRGDTTIIPCAEIFTGIGMGSGTGSGTAPDGSGRSQGEGSGGGGGGSGRPVAAVIVTPEGVRVQPIVDATKVALAAVTTLGFMGIWLTRLWRGANTNVGLRYGREFARGFGRGFRGEFGRGLGRGRRGGGMMMGRWMRATGR